LAFFFAAKPCHPLPKPITRGPNPYGLRASRFLSLVGYPATTGPRQSVEKIKEKRFKEEKIE